MEIRLTSSPAIALKLNKRKQAMISSSMQPQKIYFPPHMVHLNIKA